MKYALLTLIMLLCTSVATANEQGCIMQAEGAYVSHVQVKEKGGCVVLECTNVAARNIESALAACHQTEKDNLFCGWHDIKRVTKASLEMESPGKYHVTLRKCRT